MCHLDIVILISSVSEFHVPWHTKIISKPLVHIIFMSLVQIILTTLSFTHQESFNFDQLNYSKNFAYYLHKLGRLQNLLVLSYDEETCLYMLRAGLLCWVDRTAPQPSDLKGTACMLHELAFHACLPCARLMIPVFTGATAGRK